MEKLRKKIRRRCFRKVVIYFLIWCMVLNTSLPAVLAGPTGGTFVAVSPDGVFGTINQQVENATKVEVAALQSVIEWTSLDTVGGATGDRESLNFSQNGVTNSAVLNRVMSGLGTQFYGDLNAEAGMRIFIVNPAGIVFGQGSTVNVTQLIASNLDISNSQFLAGDYEFAGDIDGVEVNERLGVINSGTIGAEGLTEGVALIGQKILNTGTIMTTAGGFVVMAAGDRVLLGNPGSKIVVEMDSVALTGPEGFGNVVNEGGITAPGGTVVLAAGDIFSTALDVRVVSGVGSVVQDGDINADSDDGDGGSVTLTAGDEVILADGSFTTANGGESNAGANGGEVIAYASDSHNYDAIVDFDAGAKIEVMGGSPEDPTILLPEDTVEKFDGGLAELSGDHIYFDGSVDVTSESFDIPNPENVFETIKFTPEGGTLHIDPVSLVLADGAIPDDGAAIDTFYEEELESYSQAGMNTILEGDFDIIVEHMSTDGVIEGGSGDIALRTVYDTGGIEFMPNPGTGLIETAIHTEAVFEEGGGSIYMLAGSGGIKTGDLSTGIRQKDKVSEPGHIRLLTTNGGDIETGEMIVEGGSYVEISAISAGNLTVNGSVISSTNQIPSTTKGIFSAKLCLVAMDNVYVDGSEIAVEAHGKGETNADITICAGKDVTIENVDSISSYAITSENVTGNIATATVTIAAGGNKEGAGTISINGMTYDSAPDADNSGLPITVTSSTSGSGTKVLVTPASTVDSDGNLDPWDETNTDGTARSVLLIDNDVPVPPGEEGSPCYGNCPEPPLLPPVPTMLIIVDDHETIGKNVTEHYVAVLLNDNLVDGNVLENFQYDGDGTLTPFREDPEDPASPIIAFKYTPPANAEFVWDGSSNHAEFIETFTYKAEDAEGNISVNTATVTITVMNFLPVADGGFATTPKADSVGVTAAAGSDLIEFVIGSDQDLEDSVWISSYDEPAYGDLDPIYEEQDNPESHIIGFTYDPPDDLSDASFDSTGLDDAYDSFTYTVTDGYNENDSLYPGTVQINLTNELPVGGSTDILESKNVDPIVVQEGSVVTYSFDIGSDLDGDPVSIVPESITTATGTITPIEEDGIVIGFNYEPDLSVASFDQSTGETTGYAQISYDVTDGYNTSTVETKGIVDIDLINLFPVGGYTDILESKNDVIAVQEGSVVTYLFDIGSDPDGDLVTIVPGSITTATGTIISEIEEDDKVIGFNYQPDLSAASFDQTTGETTGYAQISYDVTDGYNTSTVETEGIVDIDLYNLFPVALPDSYEVDYSTPLSPVVEQGVIVGVVPAENGDYDLDLGDTLTAILEGDGSTLLGGTVKLNPNGSFTYTPPADVSGTDRFSYYVTDGYGNSESVEVTMYVGSMPPVAVPYMQPAPGLQREVIEISGCPSLVQWAASELGTDESQIQVWMANSLASDRGIMPCDACANLKQAATVLKDVDGTRVAALAEMINEFASSTAPPTEEQMASIADAIANDIEGNSQYAAAGEYLDALAKYVGILTSEIGISADKSIQFATDNYVGQLVEDGNMGVAAYVAARLAALVGSE